MISVYQRLKNIQQWVWPGTCSLCLGATRTGELLCPDCEDDLPRIWSACPRCARPLPADPLGMPCGQCQRQPPSFDRARAVFRYTDPVNRLIQRLKYRQHLPAARLLTGQLLDAVQDWLIADGRPDVLLPVPLHIGRLRARGFNQSLELARPLARHLAIPLEPGLARRIRHTDPQAELPLKLRKRNVKGAFSVFGEVQGRHIALIDDVITSGHTAGELARRLKQAGAREVSVWSVARA